MNNKNVLTVGHMTYLNSEVFYHNLAQGPWNLIACPPRKMTRLVVQGKIDVGPIPIVDIFKFENILAPVANLGVATFGPAKSVFIFSKVPISDISGKVVALTSHSSTSIKLLKILFSDYWKVGNLTYVDDYEEHDAILLIGDLAIQTKKSGLYRYCYDLGTAWTDMTDKPFVFAQWVARTDIDSGLLEQFSSALHRGLKMSLKSLNKIIDKRRNNFFDDDEIRNYINNFVYEIGHREKQGLRSFKKILEDKGI